MNKQEKIKILWKMMWLNFNRNFNMNQSRNCNGLCYLFEVAVDFNMNKLKEHIPEILQYTKKHDVHGYWWSYEGRFIPWWERHVAIWKTIRQLKKS